MGNWGCSDPPPPQTPDLRIQSYHSYICNNYKTIKLNFTWSKKLNNFIERFKINNFEEKVIAHVGLKKLGDCVNRV